MDSLSPKSKTFEVLMNLRSPKVCEHAVCHGGKERAYHPSTNGHSR